MKRLVLLVCSVICTGWFSSAVGATANSDIKLQIFPLECSFDTVAVGQSTWQQVTPENCLLPSATQTQTSIEDRLLQLSGASPLQAPLSRESVDSFIAGDKKLYSPDVKRPASNEDTTQPVHPVLVGVSAFLAAGLPDVVYAVHSSSALRLMPLPKSVKLRWPRSKR